jgi:pimeloyl-ACP methyl ester carboxylesterase
MVAPDPQHPRRFQADFPLIDLSEFARHLFLTPYLDMLRRQVPSVRVEIVPDTRHFPQLDESARTDALLDGRLSKIQPG